MSNGPPPCRHVRIQAFRGCRGLLARRIFRAFVDQSQGRGHGPTREECLLYAGHTGVSTDTDPAVLGFSPDFQQLPAWLAMRRLRNGEAFPGVVRDDTLVFDLARLHGLAIREFRVRLPEPDFLAFHRRLDAERQASRYTYGFPNGDGDCNCTTWLERLALPLLSGRMDEFVALSGFVRYPTRRFGRCT